MENALFALLGFSKTMAVDTHRAWRRFLHGISPVETMFIDDHLWNYDL
jgi:hypothetical protein